MKLAAAVVASFAAFVALVGYLSLREHRRHSEELVLQSADRISDLIQRSTEYQMLHNDREALYQMIKSTGQRAGLRRIRIFNEEGRISFSTDPAEVNTVVEQADGSLLRVSRAGRAADAPESPRPRPDLTEAERRARARDHPPHRKSARLLNGACHATRRDAAFWASSTPISPWRTWTRSSPITAATWAAHGAFGAAGIAGQRGLHPVR